ncbi:MAG: D-glycero-beta-D-manno-heptose 1,7-bisphosphate 7-phosphatase [Thiotrichales bacterium]|nr:D-glycero-beta-D-manno-heptose 1,7-bisphosphate 7-phosphatase [Thiotrichales bacterium]
MQKIIVLDRDGVINQDSDAFIKSAEEWQPIEGSIEAIKTLKMAGWRVAIATNQSGIARGYYDRTALNAMHAKLQNLLEPYSIDWISFAPYLAQDYSPARKPGCGMLRAIERALALNLKGAPMVGDTLVDVQAAQAMGMRPYLVRSGKGERTLAAHPYLAERVLVFDNLLALTRHLLDEVA